MTNIRSSLPSAWQTLTEVDLPGQSGADRLARDHIASAVRPLNLSPADLERLKVAIAEAVLKVIESGNRYPSNLPVSIRLRVSYRTLTMQSTDQENVSIPDELTVNISAQEPFQGWGFFLLERRVDDIQIVGDAAQHSIELFLYRE